MGRVLFVVSAVVSPAPLHGPRKDYQVVADVLGASVVDYGSVQQSAVLRRLARVLGMPVAQAWLAFTRRRDFDAIVTDGEHIGLPLALLLKLSRTRIAHVTI